MTLGALANKRLTGQVTITASDGKVYELALILGTIVAARSPLGSDAAARVALTSHLVSSTQVAEIARRIAAVPDADEIDVVAATVRLSLEQALRLRLQILAQRAARTFAVDDGEFVIDDQITLQVIEGGEMDVRRAVYHGARANLSEQRLDEAFRYFGTYFALRPGRDELLPLFGFSPEDQPVLEHLRTGITLPELEALHRDVDPRITRAIIYSLISCDAIPPPRGSYVTAAPAMSPAMAQARTTTTQPAIGRARTPTTRATGEHAAVGRTTTTQPAVGRAVTGSASGSGPAISRTTSTQPAQPHPTIGRTHTTITPPTGAPVTMSRTTTPPPSMPRTISNGTGTMPPVQARTTSAPFMSRVATPPSGPSMARTSSPSIPNLGRAATPSTPPASVSMARTTSDPVLSRTLSPTSVTIARTPSQQALLEEALAAGSLSLPRTVTGQTIDKEGARESFRRGEMALRREQIGEAIAEFTEACRLDPKEADYDALLAWARFCEANDKQAVAVETRKSLEKAAYKARDNPLLARFYLGRVERMLGRDQEALKHFREVLDLRPGYSQAASEVRVIEARLARK